MLKVLAFFRKHPDLTFEEFKEKYETGYAPLAQPYVSEAKKYFRRYFEPMPPASEGARQAFDFDVMTEMWFESQEDYDAMFKRLHEGEVQQLLLKEQKKLFANLEELPIILVTDERGTGAS